MTTVTIKHEDTVFEIDSEVFAAYKREAFESLNAEANAKATFKDTVESLAETTEMPKALLSKYLKAAFKAETKKQKEIGDLFEALDGVSTAKNEEEDEG